jgi:hypothetical protein
VLKHTLTGAFLLLAAVMAVGGGLARGPLAPSDGVALAQAGGAGATLEVRVAAQRLADGRTEFAFQQRNDDGSWAARRLPARRFFPADAEVGRWLSSSALTVDLPPSDASTATQVVVRIAAQLLDDGRMEFALQERDDDDSWRERRLPTGRFFPADMRVGRWLSSSTLILTTARVEFSPAGDDVPRLAIATIEFPSRPTSTDGTSLVAIDPPAEGSFAWSDERTLLFQPAFPGWQRGQRYELRVDGAASGLERDFTHSFTVGGGLEVDYVIPGDGDTEAPVEAHVLVQFNRAVAALTVLQEGDAPPVLEFDPPLTGKGEWLNTSLYRLIPDDLRPATVYSVRIPAGLTSAADGVLAADFEWSFETIQPAVVSFEPADQTKWVEPDAPVTVTFNQPMDQASVEARVALRAEHGASVATTNEWSEGNTVVTLTPRAPLSLGRDYEVVAPAGLRGASGVTTMERTARFTVVHDPQLMSTRPYNGETEANIWSMALYYNNPMDPESFEGRVSINGVDPDDIEVWAYDTDVSVYTPLDHSTTYTVRIAAGVMDRGGRTLPGYSFSFTTRPPRLPGQHLSFAAPRLFATVAADGPQVLHYHSARSEAVDFVLYQLTEAEADTLLQRGYIDPRHGGEPFQPSSDPIRKWAEPIAEDLRDQSRLYATTFGGGEPLPRGDYLLRASSERVKGLWTPSAVLMLSVVDTAIVTKIAHDELYTWVVDYGTGEPVPGVEVRVPSVNHPQIVDQAAVTGADGLALTPVVPYWVRSYREHVVRVASGGRHGVSFTGWEGWWSDSGHGLPHDHGGEIGFVYTDRPIYRPGETVFIKGIVRAEDDATYSLPEVDVATYWVRVSDPEYNELFLATELQLSGLGSLATEIVLPRLTGVGEYTVTLGRYSSRPIASVRFIVAEFRVPEFEVEVETSATDYVAGGTIATEASARFYFGSPVGDTDVEWNAFAQPTSIHVEGYEDYSFSDYDYYRRGEYREPQRGGGEARTDASGVARFGVPAALDDGEGTHEFTISATVTDANAQAVSGSATVTVHPAAWYAGIKTGSYVAQAEKPLAVHVVSVDYTGRIAPARPVTVRIYEREWERTKQRSAGGGYWYRYEIVDTEIQARMVTTNEAGEASFDFAPPSSGTYRLVAESTDEAGRIARSSRFIWVSGRDFAPWPARDDDSIELVADREEYEVGDVARVLVPAPFAGATALVTIERGRVLSSEVRTFETNSELLTIPIEDSHIPNVFVGVVLYRAPTEEDPYPRYVVGYVELPVSTAPRQLDVRVEPDHDRAAPGETVTYEVTVTDAEGRSVVADVSVAIVDEGVLALTDGDTRDAMEAFWYRRELGVRTASSLGVSIDRHNEAYGETAQGEATKIGVGEDRAEQASDDSGPAVAAAVAETAGTEKAAPDTPAVRSNFQNTALWVGQLTTDEDGLATFDLPVPDNTTTWRASAQAVTADTLAGSGSSELLVTQPLIVRPALPRFLRVGDAVGLRALVTNRTAEARDVTVAIEATGVELAKSNARTVRVEPGDSAAVEWPARARAAGTAVVRFYGLSADRRYADAVEMSLPVHLAVTPETTATGGVVEDALAIEAVYLPDYVITGQGSLELSLQGSLVGALDEELRHFKPYRYESTVRVASRVVATVAAQRATPGGLDDAQQRQLDADVAKLISSLSYEGWGWCQSCPPDLWVTAWVLIALGEARDAGHEVPDRVLNRAASPIANYVHRETDAERPADPNQHAYLLHALADASNDGREVGEIARKQAPTILAIAEEQRANLTNWGRAYALLGLLASGHATDHPAVRAMLNDLTANTIASANGNHWEDERVAGSMHNASVRITAIVLRALVEVDPGHPLIEETTRWLALARSADRWKSSVERAQGMASLGAYAALTGETRGAYDYSVLVNTDRVLAGHFDVPARDYVDATSVALGDLPLGEVSRVQFEREAGTTGRMYYGLNLRYVTPAAGIEALNRGFAVSHHYSLLDDPDTAVTSVAVGEVVRVTVTVVAPADRLFVQVEDFLPGGLEPIDPQLNIVSPWLRQQLWEEQAEAIRGSSGGYCAPWYGWCFSPWDQVNLRDDRLVLQASRLPEGVHEYVYYARATAPGDFFVAPVHAEETYLPEVFGRSDSSRFTITSGE